MRPEPDDPPIRAEHLPTMEWELERLVADGELRYLPRNPAKRDALPKVYDVAPHVEGDRRAELIATLRAYRERRG